MLKEAYKWRGGDGQNFSELKVSLDQRFILLDSYDTGDDNDLYVDTYSGTYLCHKENDRIEFTFQLD